MQPAVIKAVSFSLVTLVIIVNVGAFVGSTSVDSMPAATAGAAITTISTSSSSPTSVRPGIWSWACGYASYDGDKSPGVYEAECFKQVLESPPPWLRGWFLVVYWRDLEVEDGVFDWSSVDANLTKAASHGLQVQPVVYIYDGGNPLPDFMGNYSRPIAFHRGGKSGALEQGPNYLDPAFQERWRRVIRAFAAHLNHLPAQLKEAVWGPQVVAGITGDNRPWNGVVQDPRDTINASAWKAYSRIIAQMYIDAFVPTNIPIVANLHAGFSMQEDNGWFLSQAYEAGMRGAGIKEGTVSHFYNLNGERDLYDRESPLLLLPQPDNVSFARARGELAVEPDPAPGTYGNWRQSPWWSLQANAEWALTFGLDVWNLYAGFLGNETFAPTMEFFNRHAGHRRAAAAPAAFISFRDSLDTTNVVRWPESEYGPVNSTKNPDDYANLTRMENIAKRFASHGAKLPPALGGAASSKNSVHQKKAMALFDVCYYCFEGNYARFMHQIDPLQTSVGWWQQGPTNQPYGRFARGLDHATGKTKISVRLDYRFPGGKATTHVVYLDRGNGQWSLGLNGKRVLKVKKQNSGRWRIASANVTLLAPSVNDNDDNNSISSSSSSSSSSVGSQFDGEGNLFTLSSLDNQDDIFSLMEVLRL